MTSVAEADRGIERGLLARGSLLLGGLLLGALLAAGAQATTLSVELPDLTGPLPYGTDGPGTVQLPGQSGPQSSIGSRRISTPRRDRLVSFDLETAFSSVSAVSLHLVGHTECPEGGCSPVPQLETLFAGTIPPPGGSGLFEPPDRSQESSSSR